MKDVTIEKLQSKQYPFAVATFVDEDFSGYRAFLIDIPAVEALGATPGEALSGLDDAKAEWFAYALAKDVAVPEPNPVFSSKTSFNGRVTLRLPRSLHRQAAERAAFEGVSLNSYLTTTIQRGLMV